MCCPMMTGLVPVPVQVQVPVLVPVLVLPWHCWSTLVHDQPHSPDRSTCHIGRNLRFQVHPFNVWPWHHAMFSMMLMISAHRRMGGCMRHAETAASNNGYLVRRN